MPSLITTQSALHHLPLPSAAECEATTALNIARARTIASDRIFRALRDDEALAAPMLKLCIDALKLSVDRASVPTPEPDHARIAPELQRTLERVLRLAGDAFSASTDPATDSDGAAP